MQHLIDLTFADYCGRLILLVFLLLDAGTTIYALHHQPAGGKTMIVEGNPIVAALMRLVGPEGAMLLTKGLGIAATYLLTPIWPVFLFGGAAVLAWFVFSNIRVIRAGAALALVFGLILLVPRPAAAQDSLMVPAQFVCAGGKLLAVRVSVPAVPEPSVVTITLPENPCTAGSTQAPAPQKPPARST